jgi:16S rRNA C967 or C1407 C5-methylase (RsmB/RsmF family)
VANITLPTDFLERLERQLSADEFATTLASFERDACPAFRVNTTATTAEEVLPQLPEAHPIPWCPEAYRVAPEDRAALVSSRPFEQGHIYVQNAASFVPVVMLDPQPGETNLDLAAAPGGKTLHIASRMQNRGVLSAVEAVKSRFFRLKSNVDLAGADGLVRLYLKDGRRVGGACPEMFDRILLDAPCSSEARFDVRDASTFAHWGVKKVREATRKQGGLLMSAIQALKPGGRLVYCTCSFAPEENEGVVSRALRRTGDSLEVESITLPLPNVRPGLTKWKGKFIDPRMDRAIRVLPDDLCHGFFAVSLRKRTIEET